MNRLYHIFFSAVGFFTRIPIPKKVDFTKVKQGEATLFLPVIGWIVGGLSALVFVASQYVVPIPLALILSIAAAIYITSGFHEDGLADVFDGFGGGWNKEKILEIMKDSSIGTYGMLALIISMIAKFISLFYVPIEIIPITFLAAHSFSRAMAVSLMFDLDYARTENSKSKPFTKKISPWEMVGVILCGIIPLFIYNNHYVFLCIIPIVITRAYLHNFFFKWIDGYTGDCIGAAQQIFEIIFLISIVAIYYADLARSFV